ncbi:MAG: tetratricopeptide repeat protein [Pseudolabrys sp.]
MAEAAPQSLRADIPALLQRAAAMHQGGRLREAEKLYREVLAAQPDNFDALHLYGVLMHQRGQPVEALKLIGQALKANARAAAAHSNYGMILAALDRAAEAVESYDRAIALQPDFAGAINNRGNALRKLGRNEEAVESFERALALNPGYPEAFNNRGNALVAMQRTEEALKSYEAALAQRPTYVDALVNRAEALRLLAREDEAMASLDRALALKPDHPAALQARAKLRQTRGDTAGALTDLERLAPQKPGDADTQTGLGHLLRELGRFEEALAAYDRALALNADSVGTHNCRGNVLVELNRLDEALAAYERALAIDPDYAFALVNRGSALRYLGRADEALACFDAAIARAPDLPDAHWNKALLQLSLGDFTHGLAGYEWRWRRGIEAPRGFAQPLWQGEDIAGKTILLHAEQGLGDSIQMLRYLPLVAAKGAKIVLELPRALLPLIGDPAIARVSRGAALPPFDVHCPLMSLPLAFGTTIETIPADVPYVQVPAGRMQKWRAKLAGIPAPRVGLVWSGKADHANDHNRSIALEPLAPVLAVPGVQFVSLQQQTREGDLAEAARRPNLTRFDADLADFADTAAAICQLDLVIAVDTAVAHLAGALGKPVWILMSHIQDWRWFLGRDDSPWYPSARLFRQPHPGDWDSVVAVVATALGNFTETRRGGAG